MPIEMRHFSIHCFEILTSFCPICGILGIAVTVLGLLKLQFNGTWYSSRSLLHSHQRMSIHSTFTNTLYLMGQELVRYHQDNKLIFCKKIPEMPVLFMENFAEVLKWNLIQKANYFNSNLILHTHSLSPAITEVILFFGNNI